ncbi:hypothetical protein FACS1894113_0930 [Alphaproteobacteria bacterium]|nr:hypothetical protein FACS1894113_0930 [Alphaproteobacteria bacterium]
MSFIIAERKDLLLCAMMNSDYNPEQRDNVTIHNFAKIIKSMLAKEYSNIKK